MSAPMGESMRSASEFLGDRSLFGTGEALLRVRPNVRLRQSCRLRSSILTHQRHGLVRPQDIDRRLVHLGRDGPTRNEPHRTAKMLRGLAKVEAHPNPLWTPHRSEGPAICSLARWP